MNYPSLEDIDGCVYVMRDVESWYNTMKQITNDCYHKQRCESIYTYRIWKLALYSYGEATEYAVRGITDDKTHVRLRKTTHIITDTHNIGKSFVKKRKTSYVSF